MAANLNDLSGGRLVLGVGVGGFRQEFEALGVPFRERGRLTDEHLLAIRAAWQDDADYRSGQIPVWIGGNSDAAVRRAVRLGDAWHPLRFTPGWLAEAAGRLGASAAEQQRPQPALMPRIALRLTARRSSTTAGWPVTARSTRSPRTSTSCARSAPAPWCSTRSTATTRRRRIRRRRGEALATVAERWNQQESQDIDPERS